MISSRRGLALLVGLLIILTISTESFGQEKLDSLQKALQQNPKQDTLKVIQLNDLAYNNFSYNAGDVMTYSLRALELAQKLHYKRGEAMAYRNLALSYLLVHADITALKYLHNALKIFSALRDTDNMASTINYIGCYFATIKDYKQALPHFLKAEKMVSKQNKEIRLVILSNTGSCYDDLKQYAKGQAYYNEIEKIATETLDYKWMVICLHHSATMKLKDGESFQALVFGTKALGIISKHKLSPRSLQEVYLLLGDIHYNLRHYEEARTYYTSVVSLGRVMNSKEHVALMYNKFHSLDSIAGDYKSALKHYKMYQSMTDSLINQSKNRTVALYKIQFELDEQEAENKLLLVAKKHDEQIILYQRLILVASLLTLFIIVLALFRLKRLNGKLKNRNLIIANQNSKLEELDGIKNKIFSVISHDLRNPFAQLISFLDLFEQQLLDTEEMVELIPVMNTNARQSMGMMENLLMWSKSQLEGFRVHPDAFNVGELVRDTLDKLDTQIQEKRQIVETEGIDDVDVWADKEMVRIVVRNILSNALKFTSAHDTIHIEAHYSKEMTAIIAIRDSGVGMSPDQVNKLFSFETKSTNGTENEAGTGLGLKICYDLLVLNKGKIWVESAEGEGSTFYIQLPRKV